MPDDPLGQRGYVGYRWRYRGPLSEAKRLFPDSEAVQAFEPRLIIAVPEAIVRLELPAGTALDEIEREPPAD